MDLGSIEQAVTKAVRVCIIYGLCIVTLPRADTSNLLMNHRQSYTRYVHDFVNSLL